MTCPKCKMELVKRGGVGGDAPAPDPSQHQHIYACPNHPEVTSDKPGSCPKDGKALEKREKPPEVYWTCPMVEHSDVVSDKPGKCPKCAMELVRKERKLSEERTIWVCDMHPEQVFDMPGQCMKGACAGMALEPRKILPGSKLVWSCPEDSAERADQPGVCAKHGKPLRYRIESDLIRPGETWACPMHPERTSDKKTPCPDCKTEMRHYEFEQLLAVPAASVVDTGERTVVFVESMPGTFDAVDVKLGHRSGEYYQVLKGLAAGQRVVTAGAFLLDAETRLNPAAAAAYFGASDAAKPPGHEGHK